jgi:hypothetical protein
MGRNVNSVEKRLKRLWESSFAKEAISHFFTEASQSKTKKLKLLNTKRANTSFSKNTNHLCRGFQTKNSIIIKQENDKL